MGTSYFKSPAPPKIAGTGTNLMARAIGAPMYASAKAGTEATKDIGAAKGIGMTPMKKMTGTAAVAAKGPKGI